MSVIDVERLLQEVSSETPCGGDLEYDPEYGEMARASEGKPERQMGDSIVEAEDPDWRTVGEKATELLSRTKDLRVGVLLVQALLHTDGFEGLSDGLRVVQGMIDRYWDGLYPELDVDDDNDPTMRVNALVTLTDPDAMLNSVRTAPIVSSRVFGRFSLRDIELATGEVSAPEGGPEPVGTETIDGAFMDADVEELQATVEALGQAAGCVETIEAMVTERVGSARAVDLSDLPRMLQELQTVLAERLSRRGVSSSVAAEQPGGEPTPGGAGGPQPVVAPGEIRSREDVIRVLDRACEYFERNEPSSPVPLLLRRAKRLISKDFMEILKDLAPDGVVQAENIGGTSSES